MITVKLKVTPAGLIARGRGVVKFASGPSCGRRLVALVLAKKFDYSLPALTEYMNAQKETNR